MVVEFKPAATTIDGLAADEFHYSVPLPPEAMMTPVGALMASFTNVRGYIVTQGDYVLSTMNGGPELVSAALKNLKSGPGLGGNVGITKGRQAGLGDGACLQMYLNVDGVLDMVNPMLMMFGVPQLKTPAGMPAVTMGLVARDAAASARLFVPQELFTFIKDAKAKIQEAQENAAQGGGAPPRERGGPPQ